MLRWDAAKVYVDLEPFPEPAFMGTLSRRTTGSGDLLSFAYEPHWLQRPEAFAFDPDLALVAGPQYPSASDISFGVFRDASPGRWGRVLMHQRENIEARKEGRKPRTLTEWDFLLGVCDETRLGALRFQEAGGREFVDCEHRLAAPPITGLREIQEASLHFEQYFLEENHPEYSRWLAQLWAPGTSLGGARPKASIRDELGVLCLAKFPSRQDTRDVGAWELVAHRLASAAGIDVARRALCA